MKIHSRDRKQLFAANFGKSYFKSTAPINAYGLALGLAIPICLVAVMVAMAMAGGDAGYVLAASPLLIVAREKAARALNAAEDIRKKYKPEDQWEATDQENFDKAIKDFAEANNEVQLLQAREEQFSALDRARETYSVPTNSVEHPVGETQGKGSVREVFNRVVRFARYNEKQNQVIVPGVSDSLVQNCLEIHREAFKAFLRYGEAGLIDYANRQKHVEPREIHALMSSDQSLGGALVPEDIRSEIIRADAGSAVLANIVRVEPTGRDALSWPKVAAHSTDARRTSGFEGKFRKKAYVSGGTAPTTQNQPTFGRERIPVHDWTPDAVEVETNLLEDADANVESIIAQAIGECLAFDKDDAILAGTGVGQPEGILNAGISTVNSAGATSIGYGGVIGMYTELPQQYRRNATWLMHSRTMGAILQLNTGTGGSYLFPPNQWNSTILGRPVVFIDSDDIDKPTDAGGTAFTAGDFPVIFGDFKRYIIAQRQALRIQRLVERFAPNVGLLPTSRIGGQVVLTQAFRIMKISA